MSTHYLFSQIDFGEFTEAKKRNLAQKIDRISEKNIKEKSVERIAAELYHEYSLECPSLKIQDTYQLKPVGITINVDSEYKGKNGLKIDGTRLEIVLPTEGNSELLNIRPVVYHADPPYGIILKNEIRFVYEINIFHDYSTVRESYDSNLINIQYWLDNLKKDIEIFNEKLQKEIHAALLFRNGNIYEYSFIANAIGFPVR